MQEPISAFPIQPRAVVERYSEASPRGPTIEMQEGIQMRTHPCRLFASAAKMSARKSFR